MLIFLSIKCWYQGFYEYGYFHSRIVVWRYASRPTREMVSLYIYFFHWRYNPLWVCILQPSSGAIASSRTRFLDHTQRRATVGRTPLDE